MAKEKTKIIIGQKFSSLIVVEDLGLIFVNDRRRHCAIVKCECGNKKLARVSSLTKNVMQSCGCIAHKKLLKFSYKHGMHRTKIFRLWSGLFTRCYNKASPSYKYYGSRGIKVCKRWHVFINFYNDMGNRPKNKSLDRIDNDKGYKPSNCRWATYKQQANNRSNNVN